MTKQQLVGLIYSGRLDSILEPLQDAIRARKRALQDQKAAENLVALTPGTRVRIHSLRPKYLNGMEGTVEDRPARRNGDIAVKADYKPSARYNEHLNIPASCLEAI